VAFPSVISFAETSILFLTLFAVLLCFWFTKIIFISNIIEFICQNYDFVLHFGYEDILYSLHLVVMCFNLFLTFFKLCMRVILCPCDKPSVSLSSDTRERALSDGSHRVDVDTFYVRSE
jgi:hypothetical protein